MDGSFNPIHALPIYPTNNSCSCGAGLFVFGINRKTPISKEMSEIIYERLSTQFVQLIENMTDIYAKLQSASIQSEKNPYQRES